MTDAPNIIISHSILQASNKKKEYKNNCVEYGDSYIR